MSERLFVSQYFSIKDQEKVCESRMYRKEVDLEDILDGEKVKLDQKEVTFLFDDHIYYSKDSVPTSMYEKLEEDNIYIKKEVFSSLEIQDLDDLNKFINNSDEFIRI